jgi:hypothetical protein
MNRRAQIPASIQILRTPPSLKPAVLSLLPLSIRYILHRHIPDRVVWEIFPS